MFVKDFEATSIAPCAMFVNLAYRQLTAHSLFYYRHSSLKKCKYFKFKVTNGCELKLITHKLEVKF